MDTQQLTVQVNDELTLDAGHFAFVGDGDDRLRVITPPRTTMFEQLLSYLDAKPLPLPANWAYLPLPTAGQEGVAAAALCVRWGSYFSVLADQSKPLWSLAHSKELRARVSRISNSEMARINVEASANMAAWVDIMRSDPGGRYSELVAKALAWLPMPQRKVRAVEYSRFYDLVIPELRQQLITQIPPDKRVPVSHPSRVFGNALVNYGWRRGPIENVHAGEPPPNFPLDRCRITAGELRDLMRHCAAFFRAGVNVCQLLHNESPVAWAEQVLPLGPEDTILNVAPYAWTLTAASREVRDFCPAVATKREYDL